MLPKNVQIVMDTLLCAGYEVYAVGGCVRDRLLGKTPDDWDLTTSALPEETMRCFADLPQNLNGLKHGTVGVILYGSMLEITTYRIDGKYRDNRHPEKITYTASLKKDLARRDFTVNAIAMDRQERLIDPFGGCADIGRRLIRCVGKPKTRFREDALRILRGLRFASLPGFSLEKHTLDAANACAPLLSRIAVERVYTEVKKMLALPGAGDVMASTLPVFRAVFPTLSVTEDAWTLVCRRVKESGKNPELSFLCILEHTNIEQEMNALKMEKKRKKRLLTAYALRDTVWDGKRALARAMSEHGRDIILLLCRFQILTGRCDASWMTVAEDAARGCVSLSELAVNGQDLKAAGFRGQRIREVLECLLTAVIDGACPNKKEALLDYCGGMKRTKRGSV